MDSDQFDGMTPADTQTTQASDTLTDQVRDMLHRRERWGIMKGMNTAAEIVLKAGHIEAANLLVAKFDEMNG